jgi:hypothetical protein
MWTADIVGLDGSSRPFEFKKWGAEEATDTYLDLLAVGGSSLGSLANLYVSGKAETTDLGSSAIETMMRQLSDGLTKNRDLTKRLIRKLSAEGVLCNGGPIKYDTFYADDLSLSWKVIMANLQVQYGTFFQGLGLSAGALSSPEAEEKAPSP